MPAPKQRSSYVWLHFQDMGDKAKCLHCGKFSSIMNGSTGNMRRHLKSKHSNIDITKSHPGNIIITNQSNPTEISEPEMQTVHSEEVVTTSVELPCTNTATVKHIVDVSQQPVAYYIIESYDAQRGKDIDKQLIKFITKDLYPFTLVEEEEFVKFVNMLNPNYTVPSRKTLSDSAQTEVYQSCIEELHSNLKDVTSVVLTIDRWTSVKEEKCISVTAFYLNKNLEVQNNMLDSVSLAKNCSNDDLSSVLQQLIENWGLSNKILAVVTDGSEDIVCTVKNCNWNHIYCFAHMLNTIVEAGLAEIQTFLDKVRSIIEYFKTNSEASNKFLLIQRQMGLAQYKLKTDVKKKWSTTFDMLTKFEKNKKSLLSAIEQMHLDCFLLTSSDFEFSDYVIKLLIVFNSIRVELSSDKTVPLSKVPHMIRFIRKHLTTILQKSNVPPEVLKMGEKLKKELNSFEVLEKNEIVCQSVILDPRFKKRGIPTELFEETSSCLQRNIISVREAILKEKHVEISSESMEETIPDESEFSIDMWGEFKSVEMPSQQNPKATSFVELDAYLCDEYLPMDSNPLTYWADVSNQNKFPALFELAKRLLCVPATSVSCERIYSKRGSILTAKRNYLANKNFKQMLFLHHNL